MLTEKEQAIKRVIQPVICSWFRHYRAEHKLSQEAMAKNFMMSVRSYVDLEQAISFPSALTLAQFLLLLSKEEQRQILIEFRMEIDKVR